MNQSEDVHSQIHVATPRLDLALNASRRTVERLASVLRENGSFGPQHADIASYYKAPALFLVSGRNRLAHRVLDHVKDTFLRENGDLQPTGDALLSQYPAYPTAWIAIAAQRLGRFDLSYHCWSRLQQYLHPEFRGACLSPAKDLRSGEHSAAPYRIEMLMSAHLGVAALFFGRKDIAQGCGECLLRFLSLQPKPDSCFYLRMDDAGGLITHFPDAQRFTHCVDAMAKDQGWFFIGYPIAFLSWLYQATARKDFLQGAKGYLEFALGAKELPHEHFAHKVAWGASILAELTGDERAWNLCESIVETLLAQQSTDGLWLAGQTPQLRFDQSAEVALWLLEIAARNRFTLEP